MTFDMVNREADEAIDRDALLALYFDFARQFFDYAALFLVHGDIAEGRDAFGSGAPRERVVGVGVPLDLPVPSLMSKARDTLGPVVASVSGDGLDAELRADLMRPAQGEMAIIPLVVRSRPVALLLGDCGDSGIDAASLQQIAACGVAIGRAFERLIMRKKKEGFATNVAAPHAAPIPAAAIDGSSKEPGSPPRPAKYAEVVGSSVFPVQTSPFLSRPPPSNIAVVRPLSSPPLPREDPESSHAHEPDSGGGPSGVQGATFSPGAPLVPRDMVSTTESGSNKVEVAIPPELDSGALFDMLGWEGPGSDPESPPPSEAHAVPPHRPPSARSGPPEAGLPSVIVNLDHELNAIVDRLVAGVSDEERGEAEGELLRQGERAMRVIMARFPGPVACERSRVVTMAGQPKPSECGVLLRLVARERKVALPFVLERLADPDPEVRGWATCLLSELPYVEALPLLFRRLCDTDAAIQAAAIHAIVAVGRGARIETRAATREHARALDPVERAAAMRVMGHLRDPLLVPELVRALVDDHSQSGRSGTRRTRSGRVPGLRDGRAAVGAVVGPPFDAAPNRVAYRCLDARIRRYSSRSVRRTAGRHGRSISGIRPICRRANANGPNSATATGGRPTAVDGFARGSARFQSRSLHRAIFLGGAASNRLRRPNACGSDRVGCPRPLASGVL